MVGLGSLLAREFVFRQKPVLSKLTNSSKIRAIFEKNESLELHLGCDGEHFGQLAGVSKQFCTNNL